MIRKTYPAILPDLPTPDYHSRSEVSSTQLNTLDASTPAHFKGAKRKETPAMRFGTLVHIAVLEPHNLELSYIAIEGDRRTKAVKEKVAEAQNAGLEIVSVEDMDRARRIADAVHALPDARALLEDPNRMIESTVLWRDRGDGIACRARPDLVAQNVCVDLKTARDASPTGFADAAARLRYPVQAAHYMAGLEAAFTACDAFVFVAVEPEPPFAAAIYDAPKIVLSEGMARRDRALDLLTRCRAEQHFPALNYSKRTESSGATDTRIASENRCDSMPSLYPFLFSNPIGRAIEGDTTGLTKKGEIPCAMMADFGNGATPKPADTNSRAVVVLPTSIVQANGRPVRARASSINMRFPVPRRGRIRFSSDKSAQLRDVFGARRCSGKSAITKGSSNMNSKLVMGSKAGTGQMPMSASPSATASATSFAAKSKTRYRA